MSLLSSVTRAPRAIAADLRDVVAKVEHSPLPSHLANGLQLLHEFAESVCAELERAAVATGHAVDAEARQVADAVAGEAASTDLPPFPFAF